MTEAILIDSSAWIQSIRRNGDAAVRARVEELLDKRVAAWCEVVRLELWKGASSEEDRDKLRRLEQSLINLPITIEVWDVACHFALKARLAGTPVPTTDLIIFACARVHSVTIEHADKHFEMLKSLT